MLKALKNITATLLVVLIILMCCACNDNSIDTSSSAIIESSHTVNNTDEEQISGESTIENENSAITESEDISVEVSEAPIEQRVNFLACPDNIIHPSVFYDAIERAAKNNGTKPDYSDLHNAEYDFYQIYKNVAERIAKADIAYLNQETLTGGTSGKIIGYPCFNSPMAVANTMMDLGFDVINVAHNHMLDSGNTKYLEHCSNTFKELGAEVIGYYPTKDSVNSIPVVENNGIKIAFLAYTYDTNGIRISSKSDFAIPYFSESLITQQVAIAKEISDFVIVSCHWGYENTFSANSDQKRYAALMNELGVDLILGMHPHVIQPMQWMIHENGNKSLVVYSLGNFVSGMVSGSNMLAGMLSIEIVKDSETNEVYIDSPTFIPIVTHYVKKGGVASNDTGYRDFEIYYLTYYTEEIAATHGVCVYEKSHSSTLVGGKFSKKSLLSTVYKYIPLEFLPEEYK